MATNHNITTDGKIITDDDIKKAKGQGNKLWDRVVDDVMLSYPNNPFDGLDTVSIAPITLRVAKALDIDEAFYKEFEGDIIEFLYDYISGASGGYLGWFPYHCFGSMTQFLKYCEITEWDKNDPLALYANNRILLATSAYVETAYAICHGFLDAEFFDG